MNHVIEIEAGLGIGGDANKDRKTKDGQEPLARLDALVEAIDLRANYVGPVLEDILHINHEVWPSSLRQ